MQALLYWFARAIILCIQALPIEFVARLGRFCGALAHLSDARHRRVARNNLRRCFPEKSETELRSIIRDNFRRLGENYACALKTASMTEDELLTRVDILGREKLAQPPGKPANRIVAIGHFGNFELYTLLAHSVPGFQGASTFRGLNQPAFNRLMQELRSRSGCFFFERRSGVRDLMRLLARQNVLLGLLTDQHGGRKGVWGPFFGIECSTNPAPAVLALRYQSPLNTAICYRTGLARWRIEVGDEIPTHQNGSPRPIEAIMADVNAALESAIRRDPANWFWVHNRWKPRRQRKADTFVP